MIKGETKYLIADEIFTVKEGTFVFIPQTILHKTDSESCMYNERFLISFPDKIFRDDTRFIFEELCKHPLIYIPEHKLPFLEEMMQDMETEYSEKDSYTDALFHSRVLSFLALLCRLKRDIQPKLSETDQIIHNISEYISTHYAQDLSLHILSKIFAMSESHLSRKFKYITGIGINEFITHVRMTNAEKLLRDKTLSITEVAQQCGYNDSNYFSTVFKKFKGISPLKFKQNKADSN